MAYNKKFDIHEYQRNSMAAELQKERKQSVKTLSGKTGQKGTNRKKYTRPSIDVHELLKREAFATTDDKCDDHFEKNRPCPNTVYGISDQYVILDSFEKVETSRVERGEFQFNFVIQGETRNQNIGVKDELDTIIEIESFPFCIPLLSFDEFDPDIITNLEPRLNILNLQANGALPTYGGTVSNPQSQLPFCGRVTMFLKEIGLQSYSDAHGRRHHFEYNAEIDGPAAPDQDKILLKPLRVKENYLFTEPIKDVHGLTVCFYNPRNNIRFPPDCLYGVTARTDANQFIGFEYFDPTNLINLNVDDRIFIEGFNAVDPATDKPYSTLNSYMGRSEGHIIGNAGFNKVGPATPGEGTTITFRLNPDIKTNSLSPPIPVDTEIISKSRITICISKNRIRIPLRFRRVVDRLTNYVAP